MKIGSQSPTLVALTSLLDASKQQQQVEQGDQDKKAGSARDGRLSARKAERDELIQQNRDALKKIQDDIRLQNLQGLTENDEVEEDVDLNSRERLSSGAAPGQPEFKKLGQIVDIRV